MGYWDQKPVATEYQLDAIRGKKSFKPSYEHLRDIAGKNSRWRGVLEAAADRLEELEKEKQFFDDLEDFIEELNS